MAEELITDIIFRAKYEDQVTKPAEKSLGGLKGKIEKLMGGMGAGPKPAPAKEYGTFAQSFAIGGGTYGKAIVDLLGGIKDAVKSLASPKGILGLVLGFAIGRPLGIITDLLRGAVTGIAKLGKLLIDVISWPLKTIVSQFKKWFNLFKGFMIGQLVAPAIEELLLTIQPILQPFRDFLRTLVRALDPLVAKIAPKIQAFLRTLARGAEAWINKQMPKIERFLLETLPMWWDRFMEWWGDNWENFIEFVKPYWENFIEWIKEVIERPELLWETVKGLVTQAIDWISESFKTLFGYVKENFPGLVKTVELIGTVIKWIVGIGAVLVGLKVVVPVIGLLVKGVGGILGLLGMLSSGPLALLLGGVAALFGAGYAALPGEGFGSKMKNLWGGIKATWGKWFGLTKGIEMEKMPAPDRAALRKELEERKRRGLIPETPRVAPAPSMAPSVPVIITDRPIPEGVGTMEQAAMETAAGTHEMIREMRDGFGNVVGAIEESENDLGVFAMMNMEMA